MEVNNMKSDSGITGDISDEIFAVCDVAISA